MSACCGSCARGHACEGSSRKRRGKRRRANPRVFDGGCFVRVSMSAREVAAFKRSWPGSGLPNRGITFEFDKRNGDLVDLRPSNVDGSDALALSQDAWNHYATRTKRNPALAADLADVRGRARRAAAKYLRLARGAGRGRQALAKVRSLERILVSLRKNGRRRSVRRRNQLGPLASGAATGLGFALGASVARAWNGRRKRRSR